MAWHFKNLLSVLFLSFGLISLSIFFICILFNNHVVLQIIGVVYRSFVGLVVIDSELSMNRVLQFDFPQLRLGTTEITCYQNWPRTILNQRWKQKELVLSCNGYIIECRLFKRALLFTMKFLHKKCKNQHMTKS
jgi:hypothetical protein